jgi:hypothetical protein
VILENFEEETNKDKIEANYILREFNGIENVINAVIEGKPDSELNEKIF